MQAPQLRLNERQANPNPYIIFIRSLRNKKNHTDAEDILKAVAAQVGRLQLRGGANEAYSRLQMKTIMRDRFMQVHTLEEAAFNRVGGIGIMGRMPYIISVMCHEMAHIQQMNHGPKFQKLMAEIKADVSRLQAKGYHGDGFWSDGKRLADSVRMGGEGLRPSDFPEYVCGVSAADARKARRPTRGPGSSQAPGLVKGEASHRSGRQTEYTRKAGRRNNVDMGDAGARLDGGRQITREDREARKVYVDDRTQILLRQGLSATAARRKAGEMFASDNPWWKEGSTRGKTAKSKSAAEMRAEAAERRLSALAGPSNLKTESPMTEPLKFENFDRSYSPSDDEDGDDDIKPDVEEVEDPHLNAEERRREMEEEMDDDEMRGLRGGWEDYVTDSAKAGPSGSENSSRAIRDVKPDIERGQKRSPSPSGARLEGYNSKAAKTETAPIFGANIVREERLRALGLSGKSPASRRLGNDRNGTGHISATPAVNSDVKPSSTSRGVNVQVRDDGRSGWGCKVCTYINLEDHGRCEMCQARPDGTIPAGLR